MASTDAASGAVFPAGTYAAATWSIPSDYGGMTAALLRRSRVFAERAGVHVKILTFDPELDVRRARADLTARGELVPGVTLHNLWEDLRDLPDGAAGVVPWSRPRDRPSAAGPSERVRVVADGGGEVRETLHFRQDGTLAASDLRTVAGHRVTLYARDGRRGRRWWSGRAAYRDWVCTVLGPGPAYVVVDVKSLVPFFATIPGDRTRIVHVVHGAHLVADARDAFGPLTATRRSMIESFDRFDAVVLLTESQRRDVVERIGPRDHAYVIPSSIDVPATPGRRDRDPYAGAVLSRLDRNKRVGQAVRGVRLAAQRTGLPLRLDVYGDGPDRERLTRHAARMPGIALHGHVVDAKSRLEDASFLLLTSRSEGQALVLVEAMARGCVPIAYDIRYGPADIISDGVDGFLVPDAGPEALAGAIERFVALGPDEVRRMRAAAHVRARAFSDDAAVARWAALFDDLSRSDRPHRPARPGRLAPVRSVGMLARAAGTALRSR